MEAAELMESGQLCPGITDFGLLRYMFNSLLVVFVSTLLVQLLATPVAYVLAGLVPVLAFVLLCFIAVLPFQFRPYTFRSTSL